MAGGSQDLLQPNNLALSWCKYTSMIPSLIRPFFKGLPTVLPWPLAPPLKPPPPPFLFQQFTQTINSICWYSKCVMHMPRIAQVWTGVPNRAAVQPVIHSGSFTPVSLSTCILWPLQCQYRCMMFSPVPVYISDNYKVLKVNAVPTRAARAQVSSAKHNKNPECMCLGSMLVSQNWCCKYTLAPSLFRNVGVAVFLFDWQYSLSLRGGEVWCGHWCKLLICLVSRMVT